MLHLLASATTQSDLSTGGAAVGGAAIIGTMKILEWWGKRKDSSDSGVMKQMKAMIDVEKVERKKLEKKISLLEKKIEEDIEKYIECVNDRATYKAKWEEHTRTIQSYQLENKDLKQKLREAS